MNFHNDTKKIFENFHKKLIDKNSEILPFGYFNIYKNKEFMKMYKNFNDVLDNVSKNSTYNEVLVKEKDVSKYLKESHFLPQEITFYIKNKMENYYIIRVDNQIEIYYFLEKKRKNDVNRVKNENRDKKTRMKLGFMLRSIKKIFQKNEDTKSLQKIYYFPTPIKKSIEHKKKGECLGVNECNSGFSTLKHLYEKCNHCSGEIYVYRKEEHNKVLIHEMIHSCYLDRELIIDDNLVKHFSSNFCVNNEILLNEIYTETLATLYNIIYTNILLKNKYDINTLYHYEWIYSISKMFQILEHFSFQKIGDLWKKNHCNNHIYQDTNLFAYYIGKPLLLWDNNSFFDFLKKYTDNGRILSNKGAIKFERLVINTFKKIVKELDNKEWIREHWIQKDKTMRLTFLETVEIY